MWKGFIHYKALGGHRYYCAQQLARGFSTEEWNSHSFHNHLWLKCHLGSIDLSFWNDPRSKQKVKTQVTTLTLQSKVRSICQSAFMRKRGSNDNPLKWSSPCSEPLFCATLKTNTGKSLAQPNSPSGWEATQSHSGTMQGSEWGLGERYWKEKPFSQEFNSKEVLLNTGHWAGPWSCGVNIRKLQIQGRLTEAYGLEGQLRELGNNCAGTTSKPHSAGRDPEGCLCFQRKQSSSLNLEVFGNDLEAEGTPLAHLEFPSSLSPGEQVTGVEQRLPALHFRNKIDTVTNLESFLYCELCIILILS